MKLEEQKLKVSLTERIQKWMEKEAEADDSWSEVAQYCYDDLAEDMANAAFVVFQACHKAQRFADEQLAEEKEFRLDECSVEALTDLFNAVNSK